MRPLLALSFILFPLLIFGQIRKGSWFTNGKAEVNSSEFGHSFHRQTTLVNADLKFGYFFSKHLVVGAEFPFVYDIDHNDENIYNYGYGPFFRVHLGDDNSSIYFQSNMNYYMSSEKVDLFATDINIGLGSHFFINDFMAINFGIEANVVNNDRLLSGINDDTKSLTINVDLEYFFQPRNPVGKINKPTIDLLKNYLKKENRYIGLSGTASIEEPTSVLFEFAKFYSDYFKWGHIIRVNSDKQVDEVLYKGNIEYSSDMQYHFNIIGNLYYAPRMLLGTWLMLQPLQEDLNPGINVELRAADFKYIFRSTIFEPAILLKRNFFINKEYDNPLHYALYFSLEQFLNENISFGGQLYVVPSDNYLHLDYFADKDLSNVYYGEIGLNYFFSK